MRFLDTHSSAQLFSGSFRFSQVSYDSLPCISQLRPLKDQRDPRQILHRGFSTLAPGLADPLPPPCDEPAPCKPTRLSGSIQWPACILQRNPAFAQQALAQREAKKWGWERIGEERGTPSSSRQKMQLRAPSGPQPPMQYRQYLVEDAGQAFLLSTGQWALPAGVRRRFKETAFVSL